MNATQVLEWLKGKKTYIMIVVGAIDQIGVLQGYWDANHLREVVEGAFGLIFLRAGIASSGPVVK